MPWDVFTLAFGKLDGQVSYVQRLLRRAGLRRTASPHPRTDSMSQVETAVLMVISRAAASTMGHEFELFRTIVSPPNLAVEVVYLVFAVLAVGLIGPYAERVEGRISVSP